MNFFMLRNNPLESLRKFQIYLADNRKRVLCCVIVYCIILFSHIRFYGFLLWQFLLPVKYICVECSVGNMNCLAVSYTVLFCIVLWYRLVSCVTFFMPPTQNSIFGELLYRRYKSHIVLFCGVMYCFALSCAVLSCSVLWCYDGYTVCKTALRWSVVLYCSVLLFPAIKFFIL